MMRVRLYVAAIALIALTSCATREKVYDFQALAHAAIELEMDIEEDDNHKLYITAAEWIGTPYKSAGNNFQGVDCSGLVKEIYKKVYNKRLERGCEKQRKNNCKKVSKSSLKEGDLVFFHNGKKKKLATHVGIYLKEGKFVHASTQRGVCVSSLDEDYWQKTWMEGGRVKK